MYRQNSFNKVGRQIKSFLTKERRDRVNQMNSSSVVIHTLMKNTTYFVRIQTQVKNICSRSRNSGFIVGRPTLPIKIKTAVESELVISIFIRCF